MKFLTLFLALCFALSACSSMPQSKNCEDDRSGVIGTGITAECLKP